MLCCKEASDQGLPWIHFSCSWFYLGVLGEQFRKVYPFSDFLGWLFLPSFHRFVVKSSIFLVDALFLCVELVNFSEEFFSFFADFLDIVFSMLVVIVIFPHKEKTLPHC
jgi:hypothetical protein